MDQSPSARDLVILQRMWMGASCFPLELHRAGLCCVGEGRAGLLRAAGKPVPGHVAREGQSEAGRRLMDDCERGSPGVPVEAAGQAHWSPVATVTYNRQLCGL